MNNNTVKWLDHEFEVCTPGGEWNDVPGVYIFTGVNSKGLWQALYIGKADSFKNRLADHERWEEARKLGATHVHAKVVRPIAEREALEALLIGRCQPPLNVQLK